MLAYFDMSVYYISIHTHVNQHMSMYARIYVDVQRMYYTNVYATHYANIYADLT